MPTGLIITGVALFAAMVTVAIAIKIMASLRKVVETNKVHIVQSKKKTTSYGAGKTDGNVYYLWPSWLPVLGVTRIEMPISNFEMLIHDYVAYDKDRVPFKLDVAAFFRIEDTNLAAARNTSFEELKTQLQVVLQGAVRTILAQHDIHEIMTERAKFGKAFTDEVSEGLKSWGVEPVKNMELMDIRDEQTDAGPIRSIMAMKTSQIEGESRKQVAENNQKAKQAEIDAQRAVDMQEQDALEQVGKRTADKEREVGLAQQRTQQAIQVEQAQTSEKTMAVTRVNAIKQAEIDRDAAVVKADRDKQTAIIAADAALEQAKKQAEGVIAQGEAAGKAKAAELMAPVDAQIKLADKIAELPAYQQYLIALEVVKAQQNVGTAQAQALKSAEIKIFANSGNASTGLANVGELFSAQGGMKLGAALEGLKAIPEGKALLDALQGIVSKAPAGTVEATSAAPKTGKSGSNGSAEPVQAASSEG